MKNELSRRGFIGTGAAAGGLAGATVLSAGTPKTDASKTRSYNSEMEYRQLGRTGLMISAVCLGGHWKRLNKFAPNAFEKHWLKEIQLDDPGFVQNRDEVVSKCIDSGINYIDACTAPECMAYSRALKGRRDKMYLGWSWYEKEARFEDWRTADKLMQSFDEGLRKAKQEYVDLWRITCFSNKVHTPGECEAIIEALHRAHKQGKARFTGVSSHNRPWLTMMLQEYPNEMDVIVTPYTAASKIVPKDSLFDSAVKNGVGIFGIKPFSSNALFQGDGTPGHPKAEEDNRKARLAIRYILENEAITAPIPGIADACQLDNLVLAIKERRESAQLTHRERSELALATDGMWEKLPRHYQWLKDWEYV
jgi:aryl-alcohol dehydrogenase-like predicted oxidoreductase